MDYQKLCSYKNGSLDVCCCTSKVCNVGNFEAIFQFMKYSSPHPHIIDLDWTVFNMSADHVEQITAPSFITQELLELPLFQKKIKTIELERHLNTEPFMPFCYLYDQSCSKEFGVGLKISKFDDVCYCSLFRPGNQVKPPSSFRLNR